MVKNAAGYNLCRLMIGSLGTLGVITQVTLMVRPMPETSALVACDVPDFDAAERLLAALVHTRDPARRPSSCWPGRAGRTIRRSDRCSESSVARLFVGFEGSRAEVDWMIGQLRDEWRERGRIARR